MKKNLSSKRKLPNTWCKRDTVWAIMSSICILIFVIHYSTLFVKASSTNPLPYYSSQVSEDNSWLLSNINIIKSSFPNTPHILVVYEDTSYPNDLRFRVVNFPDLNSFYAYNSNLQQINIENFTDYRSDYFYTPYNTYYEQSIMRYYQGSLSKNYGTTNAFKGSLFGNHVLQNNITYCYPIYWDKDYSFNGVEVLKLGEKPTPPVQSSGHATEPDTTGNNVITGHAQQPNTPNFPTFTPPPIDTTNLESLVESLIDYVKEFADFVGECFSTFFAWLVEVIQNGLQSIIDNIKVLINNLYDNFVSLFVPIAENLLYLIEPLNENEVIGFLEETGFYTDFSSMTELVNDSFDVFENISEPQTFRIPIHLENIEILNCNTQYIDLGWFDSCKTALRAFMWCITTFGLLYSIIDALPSYISGGDE